MERVIVMCRGGEKIWCVCKGRKYSITPPPVLDRLGILPPSAFKLSYYSSLAVALEAVVTSSYK